ncbi:methyl-accepting chemotaxis protein [Vibrio sp. Of7-15]|uniref:methyl-accepting chemotaxis protein n=1 Tax=Vibrio sp. Of7-15 TaxID=2724879 RepID=UPI001EF3D053|nr:methyl-accepting chemotaxis protein [Vibrio sp. Of7-15]MCG7499786.1 methyl-accepting chemotaxis protein [Vibrio sp. Of7-15]
MKNMSLKMKLISLILVALVLISAVLTKVAESQMREQNSIAIQSRLDGVADASIQGIERWLNLQRSIVSTVTEYSSPEDRSKALKQAELSGKFDLVYIGTPSGEMIRSTPRPRKGYDPRVRPWYKAAVAASDIVLSPAYVDAVTNELVITLAKAFQKAGSLAGVVGGDVSIAQLIEDINTLEVGEKGQAILLESDGRIIAYPNQNLLLKSATDISPALTLSRIEHLMQTGDYEPIEIQGTEKYIYFEPVNSANWILGIILDKETETEANDLLLTSFLLTSVGLTIVVVLIAAYLVAFLMRDLLRVSSALEEIASGGGDLTRRITPNANDEVGMLATNFNLFVESLHGILVKLSDISQQLMAQSNKAAQAARDNSQSVTRQLDEINMVATAVTEMSSATREIADNADHTAKNSEDTLSLSQNGSKQVAQSQDSINSLATEVNSAKQVIEELNTHAQSINSIISAIQGIAEQTNLLALNAAIEAARAGETGRGFAVVADEVRVLSQRTHDSTQEIQSTIETLQATTQRAVNIMLESGKMTETSVNDAESASVSLDQINTSVRQISDMAVQIASAAEEQTSVTSEISRNTEEIREVANTLVSESELAADAASDLNTLAQELETEVKRFIL